MITYINNIIKKHIKFLSDCKFILWLVKQMIVCYIKGDKDGVLECKCFIKIHWNYKSTKIS
jgi:hypothetical protein